MNNKNSKSKKTISPKKQNPKSEKKVKNKAAKYIKRTFPLPPQPENFKQINELCDIGKLELVDYKGTITECNIYGSPKKKFFTDITGINNFKERLQKGLIKELKYKNKSLYMPKTLNFEGSMMFPRPISLPFVNQTEKADKLVDTVKKEGRIFELKNKKIFSLKKPLKDNNIIPSFICHKIGKNNPNDRNKLIKLIDNFITEKKEEHKLESDYIHRAPSIKALKNYKKKLNENMTNDLYNGKIIAPTNQKDIMLKYNSIRKAIYNSGIKNSKKKLLQNFDISKIVNYETYKNLYKIKGVGDKNNIFKHPEMLTTFSSENNTLKDVNLTDSNEDINYRTFLPNESQKNSMNKTHSSYTKIKYKLSNNKNKPILKNNNEYTIDDDKFKKTITTVFDKNNDESLTNTFYVNNEQVNSIKNLYIPNKFNFNLKNKYNILNSEKYNKTTSTFYKNKKQRLSKLKDNDSKDNNSNINTIKDKDNYSYTSEDKKDENSILKKYQLGHNFRTIKDIKKIAEHENDLLKGYVSPEVINDYRPMKFSKIKKKDFSLKHYLNELELIKKVNIIALEKERKINLFKDNLLRKKLQGKKILEYNSKK